jgi:hypothetical protein
VTKAIEENYDGDIVYCEPTPPPSPGSDKEVEEEEEYVDQTAWNDFCRNYYNLFYKNLSLMDLKQTCITNMVPTGSRNRMIAKLVEDEWYSFHNYVKKKYGLNDDEAVYKYRLARALTDAQKAYVHKVYAYLSWPSRVRRSEEDNTYPTTILP